MTARSRLYLGAIRPTAAWLERFEHNRERLPEIPWREASLTAEERRAVVASIQEFQLGESSEGRNLMRAAARYARCVRDPEYVSAIELFIAEEQSHAAWLGSYLDAVGAPRLARSWRDRIFRRLRKLAGIETAICVLLTAEIIAKVYYRALRDATRCPALRAICVRILEDERAHVEFHCERLFLVRCMRPAWRGRACLLLQRTLFASAMLAVWPGHRPVFRRAGLSLRAYWAAGWRQFEEAERIVSE